LRDSFSCPYFSFYKEDALLSFFSLTPDDSKTHISRVQHFRVDSDYTKAHVSVHRSLNSLVEKGLVTTFRFAEYSMTISLTDEGMKKAAALLGIAAFQSPLDS
jgi:DNA-binding MarR family transcriptional regulator